MGDPKCPKCKKRMAKTIAFQMLTKIDGEWVDLRVCKTCYLAGSNAPALDVRGGLTMAQRSKKV